MHDYYIAKQTESRLRELRTEAARENRAPRSARGRRGWQGAIGRIVAPRTDASSDPVACCA